MIRPRLPVIPSVARNLKSVTTRRDSRGSVYILTDGMRILHVGAALETDILDSSLRFAAFRMTVAGLLSKWGNSQMPTPVSPAGERYREGVAPRSAYNGGS